MGAALIGACLWDGAQVGAVTCSWCWQPGSGLLPAHKAQPWWQWDPVSPPSVFRAWGSPLPAASVPVSKLHHVAPAHYEQDPGPGSLLLLLSTSVPATKGSLGCPRCSCPFPSLQGSRWGLIAGICCLHLPSQLSVTESSFPKCCSLS